MPPEIQPAAPSTTYRQSSTGEITLNDASYQPALDAMDVAVWGLPTCSSIDRFEFPSFFEHIMVPDQEFNSTSAPPQAPPDMASMMPDQDWLDDSDIFGASFTPTIDAAMLEGFLFPEFTDGDPSDQPGAAETTAETAAPSDAQRRHAIFQRSPWLWKPPANMGAFSEHKGVSMVEDSLDIAASPNQPYLPKLNLPDRLSGQSRDRIFQMVLRTAKSQVSIPSFPSAACLETLLVVGIAKRVETDAWIHPYTFRSEQTRPELLAALIAAGCVCFGLPQVIQTGLFLFEIVRVALNKLVESDNSAIRDLQYLQAGEWCHKIPSRQSSLLILQQ